jgi:hypothetical protein
MVFVETEK